MSYVLSVSPEPAAQALAHPAGRLSFAADVSDVHADVEAGASGREGFPVAKDGRLSGPPVADLTNPTVWLGL